MIKVLLKRLITVIYLLRYRRKIKHGKNLLLRGMQVRGGGGKILIGENSYLRNCKFIFEGPENKVIIGDNVKLNGVEFILRYGGYNTISIGDSTSCGGSLQLEASEGTKIFIGEDCMFSHNIWLTTTDSHSILDDNGKRINPAQDILIGKHVWIGLNSKVLKGSVIEDNCIVGANTIYLGSVRGCPNTIFAGTPAREIKNDINWNRKLL